MAAVCLLGGIAHEAYAWPISDIIWDPVDIGDAVDDSNPADLDVVGGTAPNGNSYPALYFAYDGVNLCFRMRMNLPPSSGSIPTEFGSFDWIFGLNTVISGAPDSPEYGLMVSRSGKDDFVGLAPAWSGSVGAPTWKDVRYDVDPLVIPYVTTLPNGTYARWGIAADGSDFGEDQDYFVDVCMPYSYFLANSGLPARTPLQVAFTTSTQLNGQPKDAPDDPTPWPLSPGVTMLPELATSPPTLSFGHVLVGTSGTAVLSATNVGSATLQNVTMGAAVGSSEFTGTSSSTPYLRPGATHDRIYTYTPVDRGTDSATVTVAADNAYNGTFTADLTGTGVAPVSQVDDSLGTVFGRIGSTVTASVIITNIGDGNLSGIAGSGVPDVPGGGSNLNGTIDTNGLYFTLVGSPAFSIPNAPLPDSQTFDYTYIPTERTTTVDTLYAHFANGGGNTNSPHDVPFTLSATGVGPVYDSDMPPGATMDFGKVFWYGPPEDVAFQIFNTTTDPDGGDPTVTALSILSYEVIGTPPGMFQLLDFEPTAIKPGEILDLVIRLTPGIIIGKYVGQLRIVTDVDAPYGLPGRDYTYTLEVLVRTPEPTSLSLLGLGALALARRRRRR